MPKILVVDDEEEVREILEMDLEDAGYQTCAAGSGNAALRVLEKEAKNVSAIISDVRMADGDGVYLLKEVRKRFPEISTLILMTGFSGHSKEQLLEIGAAEVFDKPLAMTELIQFLKGRA